MCCSLQLVLLNRDEKVATHASHSALILIAFPTVSTQCTHTCRSALYVLQVATQMSRNRRLCPVTLRILDSIPEAAVSEAEGFECHFASQSLAGVAGSSSIEAAFLLLLASALLLRLSVTYPSDLSFCLFCQDMAKRGGGESTFSALGGGAHLKPHCGSTNCRLTCHLPLLVPDGCSIRCGEEERPYREGELMIFDDS